MLAVSAASCSRPAPEAAPETIRMLAGGPIAEPFLFEYRKALPSLRLTMEPSRGSEFVVSALQHGIADVGFAQADVVYMAYRAPVNDQQPLTELRGVAIGGTANVYIVVRAGSPYRTVADLKKRRIGIFPPTTHALVYARMILDAYGLGPANVEFVEYLPDEMAAHLQDGTIDAGTFGGPGILGLSQVNWTAGMRLLPLTGEPVTTLRGKYPFFTPVVVTADKIPRQEGDVPTLGVDSLVVCRKDLPDERVYELTRALFEAAGRVARSTANVPAVDANLSAATPIPLHPGAARFYREREVFQ